MTRNLKQTTIGVVAGALLAAVGSGPAEAQTDSIPRLDIGTVAAELELSAERAGELAPLLEQLNDAFDRRVEHRQQAIEMREGIRTTHEQIAETLSAAEFREFRMLLRETAFGPRSGRAGRGLVRGGIRGGGWNDRPSMRRGRGNLGLGAPIRGVRGYAGRELPSRGMRPRARWDDCPYWFPDDIDSSN